jgi:hypothetical protein
MQQHQHTVVEPFVVHDTVCSDLMDIEHIGDGIYRFTFAAKTRDLMTYEEVYEVRLKIVLPASSVFRAALWALKAIGARCCGHFVMDRCKLH